MKTIEYKITVEGFAKGFDDPQALNDKFVQLIEAWGLQCHIEMVEVQQERSLEC